MSSYDPEIDPEIRREAEAAEREAERVAEENRRREELHEEIRAEFERLERERAASEMNATKTLASLNATPADDKPSPTERAEQPLPKAQTSADTADTADSTTDTPGDSSSERRKQRRARNRKAIDEVVSGTILSNNRAKKAYPYLVAVGVLLLVYLMSSFSVQRLYHRRQVLERQVQEYRTRSINMSSEAKNVSSRSAVARRVEQAGLPLKESTTPVNVIDAD